MKPGLGKLIALIALFGLVSACAQTRTITLEAAPADLFDAEVPIEVIGSGSVGGRHGYVVAGAGEGLAVGAGGGALGSVAGGASTGNPFGLALGIVLAPVFAVGGGIYGAAVAHPAEKTEAAIAAIEQVYGDEAFLGRSMAWSLSGYRLSGFRIKHGATALMPAQRWRPVLLAQDTSLKNVAPQCRRTACA